MVITKEILDELNEQAKANPRLRQSMDLRNSSEDLSQRMLNALEPETVMPIHRHQKTSETVVCLRGRLVWEYYGLTDLRRDGNTDLRIYGEADLRKFGLTETIELSPNGQVVALNVPAGQWHTVKALEPGSVIIGYKKVVRQVG